MLLADYNIKRKYEISGKQYRHLSTCSYTSKMVKF